MTIEKSPSESAPREGDVIFRADGASFSYVGARARDNAGRFLPPAPFGDGCFEVTDSEGEAFIVARAVERDDELRSAVHDDGRRRAWRASVALRPFTALEVAAMDRARTQGGR